MRARRRPRRLTRRVPERGAVAPANAPARAGVARAGRAAARRYGAPALVLQPAPRRAAGATGVARGVATIRPAPGAGLKRRAVPRAISGCPRRPSAGPAARTAAAEEGAGGAVAEAGRRRRTREAEARPDADKEAVPSKLLTPVRTRPARPKPRPLEPAKRRVVAPPTPGAAACPAGARAGPPLPTRRTTEAASLQKQEWRTAGLGPPAQVRGRRASACRSSHFLLEFLTPSPTEAVRRAPGSAGQPRGARETSPGPKETRKRAPTPPI